MAASPTILRLFIGTDPDPTMPSPNSLLQSWFMHCDEDLDTRLEFVSDAGDADFVTLPHEWTTYTKRDSLEVPFEMERVAHASNKPFVVFSHTDFEPRLPFKQRFIHVTCGATRGRQPDNVKPFVISPFIGSQYLDPTDLPSPSRPPRREKPVVGFCGGAADPIPRMRELANYGVAVARHVQSRRSKRSLLPELGARREYRGRVLHELEKSSDIETDFIKVTEYRGGGTSTNEDPNHPSVTRFRTNLEHCDYAVALRGRGNYSFRIAESLRFARVPLHIDTNDTLPFERVVDWSQFMIDVPANELATAGSKVRAHYDSMDDAEYAALQMRCYELWRGRFTRQALVNHFPEYLEVMRSA